MPTDYELKSKYFLQQEGYAYWFNIDNHPTLYFCKFNKDNYEDNLFDQYKVMLPEHLKTAVIKRKAEFLVGRYCASHALIHHGISNFSIEIGKHRNPIWPRGICGTISHCQDYAVAAASPETETMGIGIDIEEYVSLETAEKLRSQILYDDENLLFYGNNKELLFTLVFSIKESFFKAAYPTVQEYFNFDAVSVINIDLKEKTINLRINLDLHEKLRKGDAYTGHFYQFANTKIVTYITLNDKSKN